MFVRTNVFRNKDGSTRTYLQLAAGERVGDKELGDNNLRYDEPLLHLDQLKAVN